MNLIRMHIYWILTGTVVAFTVQIASAEESVPEASEQIVYAASAEDEEVVPIAVTCSGSGCEHQPAGGPGVKSGSYVSTGDLLRLDVALNDLRDRVVLTLTEMTSFRPNVIHIERCTGFRAGAEEWVTVWEGDESDLKDDGTLTLTFDLDDRQNFFRMVLPYID